MGKDNVNVPAGFGGLMRYNTEYKSRFMFKPVIIIIFVILIIIFVAILKMFFPVAG